MRTQHGDVADAATRQAYGGIDKLPLGTARLQAAANHHYAARNCLSALISREQIVQRPFLARLAA